MTLILDKTVFKHQSRREDVLTEYMDPVGAAYISDALSYIGANTHEAGLSSKILIMYLSRRHSSSFENASKSSYIDPIDMIS